MRADASFAVPVKLWALLCVFAGVTIGGTLTNYDTLQVTSGNLTVSGAGASSNAGTITTVTSGTAGGRKVWLTGRLLRHHG